MSNSLAPAANSTLTLHDNADSSTSDGESIGTSLKFALVFGLFDLPLSFHVATLAITFANIFH